MIAKLSASAIIVINWAWAHRSGAVPGTASSFASGILLHRLIPQSDPDINKYIYIYIYFI